MPLIGAFRLFGSRSCSFDQGVAQNHGAEQIKLSNTGRRIGYSLSLKRQSELLLFCLRYVK